MSRDCETAAFPVSSTAETVILNALEDSFNTTAHPGAVAGEITMDF